MTVKHIRARELRKNQTEAERRMWMLLRDRRLAHLKFKRQEPIGRYFVDLVCLQKRLIIELDGGQHNESPADERRTAWLESQDFKVIRFWNNDVLKKPGRGADFNPSRPKNNPLSPCGRGQG